MSNSRGEKVQVKEVFKLKLVTNYLRNSLTQEKLSGLALLSLESSLLKEIDQERIFIFFQKIKRKINI